MTDEQKIRRACAQFMDATPDYYPTQGNEEKMFAEMARLVDSLGLNPARTADWREVFAHCRERLEQKPRRQRNEQAASGNLTAAEVESWSSDRMFREMQNPAREKQIEAALSSRR